MYCEVDEDENSVMAWHDKAAERCLLHGEVADKCSLHDEERNSSMAWQELHDSQLRVGER